MTKIVLEKSGVYGYSKISVSGHSGYAEAGSDIICAYVSSSTELLMSILIDSLGIDAETDIDSEKAFVCLKILDTQKNIGYREIISAVTAGFEKQMKDFSEQFPKFVSITFA